MPVDLDGLLSHFVGASGAFDPNEVRRRLRRGPAMAPEPPVRHSGRLCRQRTETMPVASQPALRKNCRIPKRVEATRSVSRSLPTCTTAMSLAPGPVWGRGAAEPGDGVLELSDLNTFPDP
jgi:hypothetical protein